MIVFLITSAPWGTALIREKHLLEDGAYSDLNVKQWSGY